MYRFKKGFVGPILKLFIVSFKAYYKTSCFSRKELSQNQFNDFMTTPF